MLQDLRSGERLEQDDAQDWVEVVDGDVYALGTDPPRTPLCDGEAFLAGDRMLRALLPGPLPSTVPPHLDLAHRACELELSQDEARLSVGERHVVLRGEAVRVLRVYMDARTQTEEGWLGFTGAFSAWCALGGNPERSPDRLAWERGKIRARLSRAGVGSVEGLFEVRRVGPATEVRLALPPQRLHR